MFKELGAQPPRLPTKKGPSEKQQRTHSNEKQLETFRSVTELGAPLSHKIKTIPASCESTLRCTPRIKPLRGQHNRSEVREEIGATPTSRTIEERKNSVSSSVQRQQMVLPFVSDAANATTETLQSVSPCPESRTIEHPLRPPLLSGEKALREEIKYFDERKRVYPTTSANSQAVSLSVSPSPRD